MALAEYQGLANNTGILRFMVGENIKAALVDSTGRIWLITPSGHALVFAGFDRLADAFVVMLPDQVREEVEKRKGELAARIQDLRHLAPGVDL